MTLEGNLNADGSIASARASSTAQALTIVNGLGAAATRMAAPLLTDLASAATSSTALFAVGDILTLAGKKGGRDLPDLTSLSAPARLLERPARRSSSRGWGSIRSVPDDLNRTHAGTGRRRSTPPVQPRVITITGNLGTENALSLAGTVVDQRLRRRRRSLSLRARTPRAMSAIRTAKAFSPASWRTIRSARR